VAGRSGRRRREYPFNFVKWPNAVPLSAANQLPTKTKAGRPEGAVWRSKSETDVAGCAQQGLCSCEKDTAPEARQKLIIKPEYIPRDMK